MHVSKRHNGGPPFDDRPTKLRVQWGEKLTRLFEPWRHKALHSGRGCGKSHAIAEYVVLRCAAEHHRFLGVRQFQNSIRESSKETIEQKIKKFGLEKSFKIGEREIVHLKTESTMNFIGVERNPESMKSFEGASILWSEEARLMKQYALDTMIPTVRQAGSEMLWSWNPKLRTDPVDYYFRGPFPPEDALVLGLTYEDNPYFFNTEMPQEARRMHRASKQKYAHIWGGTYDEVGEARIFPNTRVGRLAVADHIRPLFGMDFGFASDPNFLVKLYVLEDTRQIYIAQEAVGYHTSLPDVPALIGTVSEVDKYTIRGDSAQPATIDFLNGQGISMVGARKGPHSVRTGIEWLLGYEIVIDPDCPHMVSEAQTYSWQVDELSNKILPIPVDADNHGWDAVRYATEDARAGNMKVHG